MKLSLTRSLSALALLCVNACSGSSAPPAAAPSNASTAPTEGAAATAAAPAVPDDARGGRLYDNWISEKGLGEIFQPDSAKTPELDGSGGPNGNGTLNDAEGKPVPNTGHDYRLKNLFGWDLRGAEGIYGADYQKKAYVLPHNLLTDTRSAADLRQWLEKGGAGLPAFGSVLDDRDLDDLVAFLIKTRNRELLTPDAVFQLDKDAPKGFKLLPGGDAARGKQRFAESCAMCHGADGRKLPIDEVESVGTLARTSGYEIWFKIAHGQPGTEMHRQLSETGGAAQAQAVLDLFAALCDRTAFPALPNGKDVPDADPRCGAYLR